MDDCGGRSTVHGLRWTCRPVDRPAARIFWVERDRLSEDGLTAIGLSIASSQMNDVASHVTPTRTLFLAPNSTVCSSCFSFRPHYFGSRLISSNAPYTNLLLLLAKTKANDILSLRVNFNATAQSSHWLVSRRIVLFRLLLLPPSLEFPFEAIGEAVTA
ncbi:hypothetical protein M422DRAFT_775921 [Sphaerobolus stellatus SS14]|nr:hypothetical protein M422DRAFT_775921 [Sphaerobolus stellatus SS14]